MSVGDRAAARGRSGPTLDPPIGLRLSAMVVDRWPLMRLGIAGALRLADVRSAGDADSLEEAMRLVGQRGAGLVVLGDATRRDVDLLERMAAGGDASPPVVMLVRMITRADLIAMLEVGVRGIALRSVTADELADLVTRVRRGERVVSPALLPSLAGFAEQVPVASRGVADMDEAAIPIPLTVKERQVLGQLAVGASNQRIADALFVAPTTVKTHLAHIYLKLGVTSRQDAMSRAVALGIIH